MDGFLLLQSLGYSNIAFYRILGTQGLSARFNVLFSDLKLSSIRLAFPKSKIEWYPQIESATIIRRLENHAISHPSS